MSTGSPLDHIVQHPIHALEADLGALTPEGVVTLFSDHISMILVAGVLLMLVLPLSLRRKKEGDEIDRLVPSGFGNFIEVICEYLRPSHRYWDRDIVHQEWMMDPEGYVKVPHTPGLGVDVDTGLVEELTVRTERIPNAE